MSRIRTPLRGMGSCLALVMVLGLSATALAQTQYERFAGRIADKAGAPLVGTVSINAASTSTKDGSFELYVPSTQRYVIRAQARGYVPASIIHTGQSLEQLDLRLTKAEAFTLTPGKPVNVVDSRGTSLSIPANALVDAQGKPATVPLTLSLYTYDLRTEQMVGDMTALDRTGAQVMLQSIGAFSAEFTDASGKLYNLAAGSKATIALRADPANPFSGTLPLWWYDEARGLWIEEGSATVRDGVAQGQVGHFSVWNFDISKVTPSCIQVTTPDASPASPVTVTVTVPAPWSRVLTLTFNTPGPHALINLPSNTDVALAIDGVPFATVNTGAPWGGTGFPPYPYGACNGSVNITSSPISTIATVQGKVLRQHRPTSGGVKVQFYKGSALVASAITDNAGNFSATVPGGSVYSVTASLTGYLSATRATLSPAAGATVTLPSITLPAGDLSGDRCVTWTNDIVPIGNGIGLTVASTDARDINGNLAVDYDDVSKAAANGGQCGPLTW